MRSLVLVFWALLFGKAWAEPLPSPLYQELSQARAQRQPLLLVVSTSWCGACKSLEADVMKAPRVEKALSAVRLLRYDAERGPGVLVAKGLRVVGYPTLLGFSQDGAELGRIQGVPEVNDLVRWIDRLVEESPPLAELEGGAAARPQDGSLQMLLARRYQKKGDRPRARAAYQRALVASTGKDEAVAARADYALRIIHLQDLLQAEPRRTLVEHLMRHPRGPMAGAVLQTISRLGSVQGDEKAREALDRYLKAATQPEALNQGIYICLRVHAYEEAERGARRLLELNPKSPLYLDTMAEVRHLRGDKEGAQRLSEQALDAARTEDQGVRDELLRNQARFRRGVREPPPDFLQEDLEPLPWEGS